MNEFAKRTGQAWKYAVWKILSAAAIIVTYLFISLYQGNSLHLPDYVVIPVYFGITITWFIWWAAAIRCPGCHKSPSWFFMSKSSVGGFQQLLGQMTKCPYCGFEPQSRPTVILPPLPPSTPTAPPL
jgi:hypothetical protein